MPASTPTPFRHASFRHAPSLRYASRHPAAAVTGLVAALLFAVSVVCWLGGWRLGLDNAVYRAGAVAVLHGDSLYGPLPALPAWAGRLPFIYPPVAALLFAPLAMLPLQIGWGLLAALTTLGVGLVLRVALTDGSRSRSRPGLGPGPGPVMFAAVLVCSFGLEPLWRTLEFGQVNILLMALVVMDVLVLPRSRWRGVLVGLAAAIKLTPLVFVLHLAITGRRADAVRALGAFAALNAIGAAVLPSDTVRFWRSQVLGGVHVTSSSWGGNQSLNGLIQRVTGEAGWAFAAAVLAGLGCLAVALPLARRLHERGEPLGAVLVTGVCGVLVSPISWTHHWVWVIPLFGLLVGRAVRSSSAGPRLAIALLALVFTGWMSEVVPLGNHRELAWTPIQMLLGNAYVLVALACAPILCLRVFRHTPGASQRNASE